MIPTIAEPVGVLGVGVEGRATISYLLNQGITDITALDRQPVSELPTGVATVFGDRHIENLGRFATLFRSPGIRPDHPALSAAGKQGTVITSAISHFLSACPAEVIGITGTLGKGTTASLTAAMIEAAGFTVHLGGNIGLSPLAFLCDVKPDDKVVLEISSFQAMDAAASPRVAVILKTTSEHLDWHLDKEEYLAAKARLLAHQGRNGMVIFNQDSPGARQIAQEGALTQRSFSIHNAVTNGVFVENDCFYRNDDTGRHALPISMSQVRLPGLFNRENIAAALLAAWAVGVPEEVACSAAERFEGLPHRLQFVTARDGIRFYNDSYATRPDATIGALDTFKDAPLALILGGSEKHADFNELAEALAAHPSLRHIALIGATAPRLAAVISQRAPSLHLSRHDEFYEAVVTATRSLSKNGVVLLSPACASFGLFPNYKVRGERFIEIAKNIAATVS